MRRLSLVAALTLGAILAIGGWSAGAPQAEAPAEAVTGPVIEGYGPVMEIADPDFPTPIDRDWKVIFDVKAGAGSPEELNRSIESVARFLNMHARAGVPAERLHAALVLHGGAGRDALGDAGYRSRFGVDNPNLPLLEKLAAAGVDIYLCGQTAAFRGLGRDELAAPVQLALSAMTVMGALQADGYAPVAF